MYDRCLTCNRPKMCDSNLWKFRGMVAGCTCVGFTLGAWSLSTLGFGDGGVGAGTLAAAWQAKMGNVTAGTIFSYLQSLGATGLGKIVFGVPTAAVISLIPLAHASEWCKLTNSNEYVDYISEKKDSKLAMNNFGEFEFWGETLG